MSEEFDLEAYERFTRKNYLENPEEPEEAQQVRAERALHDGETWPLDPRRNMAEEPPCVCPICGYDMFEKDVVNGTYYYSCTNKTCTHVEIFP
jgi:hypothetical protein